MFSPHALQAIDEGNLSDWLLSSDDEERVGFASDRELRSVRVGADVINRNQREVKKPPESEDDEVPSSSWNIHLETEVPVTCNEIVSEVSATTEVDPSNENILQNLTPKQNIRWMHRELVNTLRLEWFPPITIESRVEAPED